MFNYLYKIKYFFKKQQRGMTLLELMVVLGIFTLISGIVVYDYGSFRSSISIQNLANDIALSIRKAQSYAIGVRGIGSNFSSGHGIYFSTSTDYTEPASGSNKSFILFTDISNSKKYEYDGSNTCGSPESGNECDEILSINTKDYVVGFYLDGGNLQSGTLDIVFIRPEADALFCYKMNLSDPCSSNYSYIDILVSNGQIGVDEIQKKITIWNTGQISVN